jgi:Zn-dependent protease
MVFVLIFSYPDLYLFILTVFLFISVLAHEVSHSMIARHYGIRVRKIVLYPIGGASQIDQIPDNPRVEWRMAIAGPLTSLILGLLLLALGLIMFGGKLPSFSLLNLTPTKNLPLDLGAINIVLAAFNLIPAFPMDGGRVLRAILAERMDFSDATRYAATIGKFLGITMAFLGAFTNFWLIIIGLFVYVGAAEETESTILSRSMKNIRVIDVMYTEVAASNPETTLAEAVEIMFKARYHDIIVMKDNIMQGVVSWEEIMKKKPEERNGLRLNQFQLKKVYVFWDEPVTEAYKVMQQEKLDLVPVVDRSDATKVIGVLTNEGVALAFQKARIQV